MRKLAIIISFFALIETLPAVAKSLLFESTQKILFLETDVEKPGYWLVDFNNKPIRFVAPPNDDNKIVYENSKYTLIKRDRMPLAMGSTPFPKPKLKMTQESCSKVDLAPKLGPARSQTSGTCYAYAAMELLNYGLDEKYSAMHLAMMNEYEPQPPIKPEDLCPGQVMSPPHVMDMIGGFSGGHAHSAIKLGMEQGLCPERLLPSTSGVLSEDYEYFLEYYQETRAEMDKINEECRTELKAAGVLQLMKTLTSIKQKMETKQDLWKSEKVQNEILNMYPALKPEKIKALVYKAKSPDELMKSLNNESCREKLMKGIPPGKSAKDIITKRGLNSEKCDKWYYEDERESLLSEINKGLENQKPVSMSYVTGGLIQQAKPQSHGFHASVVGGRDWMSEEKDASGKVTRPAGCYYLVKNSWGEDWKVASGLKAQNSEKNPGYFVISEQQLMEHAYGVTRID